MAEKKYIIDNAELMAEWDWEKNISVGFDPEQISLGSDKKVWWKCPNHHSYDSKIANRINGTGCPYCAGKRAIVGISDLATVNPDLAREWHPTKNENLTPQDVVVGSNKKVWWQCERGHEWQTSVAHRSNGRRCPKCFGESKTSFPEQAIFFYLLYCVCHKRCFNLYYCFWNILL